MKRLIKRFDGTVQYTDAYQDAKSGNFKTVLVHENEAVVLNDKNICIVFSHIADDLGTNSRIETITKLFDTIWENQDLGINESRLFFKDSKDLDCTKYDLVFCYFDSFAEAIDSMDCLHDLTRNDDENIIICFKNSEGKFEFLNSKYGFSFLTTKGFFELYDKIDYFEKH